MNAIKESNKVWPVVVMCTIIILNSSCRKENPNVVNGTKFGLLLKTITNTNGYITTESFSYNNLKLLTGRNVVVTNPAGITTGNGAYTYFLNTSGILDSAASQGHDADSTGHQVASFFDNFYYHYNAGGQLIYSITVHKWGTPQHQQRDSNVYIYTGTQEVQRNLYIPGIAASYILTNKYYHTYDDRGNLINFKWESLDQASNTFQLQKTTAYQYDDKTNPFDPVSMFIYNAPYTPPPLIATLYSNNLIKLNSTGIYDWDDGGIVYNYEYNIANKPSKLIIEDAGGSQLNHTEKEYFYD